MDSAKDHWEGVYAAKAPTEVSWYQRHCALSMEFIARAGAGRAAAVIDVGGGASTLVDDLLDAGYEDLTVLDISASALEAARGRLGERAGRVAWIEADVGRAALPAGRYDVWHDRAVFHFLIDEAERARYVEAVRRAVRPGGHVIVAAFAPDGPPRCSGLPVVRYSPDRLHDEFGEAFVLVEHAAEAHRTPSGATQQFIYCFCRMPGPATSRGRGSQV